MSRGYPIILLSLCFMTSGCGLITRSPHATNVDADEKPLAEDDETIEVLEEKHAQPTRPLSETETDTETETATVARSHNAPHDVFNDPTAGLTPAPQTIQAMPKALEVRFPKNPTIEAAERLFNQALQEQHDASFVAAYDHWKQYIERFTGLPGHEQAQYNLGLTLFHLGRSAEALEPLQGLIQSTKDTILATDSRLLASECDLATSSYEEALALTFEVLPDLKTEKQAGLTRSATAAGVSAVGGKPLLKQKIRLYTLRGRAYAALGKETDAASALAAARQLIETSPQSSLSAADRRSLEASLSWRQIESLELTCARRIKASEALSEAEFLAYADAYFGCAAPARSYFCSINAFGDDQIKSQAKQAYRRLVLNPLKLKDRLPPPARVVRKQEQRVHYEREMKTLIEKTVEERSQAFRNIESCGAYDVF